MQRTRWALIVFAAAVVAGSASQGAAPAASRPEAEIMRADADFARAVADGDTARFLSFIAEITTFNGGSKNELHGRDAVGKSWAKFLAPDGPRLTWRPTAAHVLGPGDVGYSTGRSTLRVKKPDGTIAESRGEYVTVWQKQADGKWQVVFDTGSTFP
jgi:uncharacterized protein (TIGR02246 family)